MLKRLFIAILLIACMPLVASATSITEFPFTASPLADQSQDTTLGMDSYLYALDDPAGTPADTYITVQELADTVIADLVAGDIPDISATYEAADTDIVKKNEAEAISGNWEVQDDTNLSFGDDDDVSVAYDSAAAVLEFRNSSDTPIIWLDLVNASINVTATTIPGFGGHDSDAAGAERTDEFAGKFYWNMTTTTEDAETSDNWATAMLAGTEITWFEWDSSDESIIIGDGGTGEDLEFDCETSVDNEVYISSPSGATMIDIGLIVSSKVYTATYSANQTLSNKECRGGVIYVTDACDITLPAIFEGANVTIIVIGAVEVDVDVNGSDKTWRDGTPQDDGDKITSPGATGDIAVFTYYSADGWVAMTNSWTDGG